MKITNNMHIAINRQNEVYTNLFSSWKKINNSNVANELRRVYKVYRSKRFGDTVRLSTLTESLTNIKNICSNENIDEFLSTLSVNSDVKDKKDKIEALSMLLDFFKDFEFEPNFRFINTFSRKLNSSESAAKTYVINYFSLSNNPYSEDVSEKIKCSEFTEICVKLSKFRPSSKVNSRLKIYYGSQGTGKTTAALKEVDNVMVCHSALLPNDLLEDFKFIDGKAHFEPTSLYLAMLEGKKILLDEINLLPFESLRFLQSILDNKSEIQYKGKTIQIKDGFQIIGTMNLVLSGNTFGLPEPLVDRCEDIKEYKLVPEALLEALN